MTDFCVKKEKNGFTVHPVEMIEEIRKDHRGEPSRAKLAPASDDEIAITNCAFLIGLECPLVKTDEDAKYLIKNYYLVSEEELRELNPSEENKKIVLDYIDGKISAKELNRFYDDWEEKKELSEKYSNIKFD